MKCLVSTFLSTAAVCAFLGATPVAARETITGAPAGTAPITAEPPGPGHGDNNGLLGAVGAILAAPFDATTGSAANATPPKARCRVTLDFNDAEARPTTVCGP